MAFYIYVVLKKKSLYFNNLVVSMIIPQNTTQNAVFNLCNFYAFIYYAF